MRCKRLWWRLPEVHPIPVSLRARDAFERHIGGFSRLNEVVTEAPRGFYLWLDEQTIHQIDVFKNGRAENYGQVILRMASETT